MNPLSNGDDQEDTVIVPELEVFSNKLELADPNSVMRPDMSGGMPDSKDCYPDCRLDNTEIQHGVSHEGQQLPGNDSEAIVVGAVGSVALWFLTGWAEGTEVEFMIDTGCQVTILATSVFDCMCVSYHRMCSRLRPCGRRLVSAESSPLLVRGELDMTVVFPGLSCAMVLVVASIGSEGLLGMDALQLCLPHQLDLRTGQLWADGRSMLQLHQQRQDARTSAHLTTSLVLPPDSEIVAPVSVRSPSGVRPG